MPYTVAGIDVHKKVLMVVLGDVSQPHWKLQRQRFGATTPELKRLADWLAQHDTQEVVMESTAQYWKPVWMALEPHLKLHLAQAQSNRAPRGRKNDFRDAERLLRRLVANELILSFVPDPEQRGWRTMTRMKSQLIRDRVRLRNQIESLLEEMRIKLSSVVSDLLGISGRRILAALAAGETDPAKLAALGDERLRVSQAELMDALTGGSQKTHQSLLGLYLERLYLLDRQIADLEQMTAEALKPHEGAVARLAEVPGLQADSAQRIIAEIGPEAKTFPSAKQLAAWIGTCPGEEESAEQNRSARSPKGNKPMRQILAQAAQAAVRTNGSHFQAVFRRKLPQLGYPKAIWMIAHKLCRLIWKILHRGVSYIEYGEYPNPQARKRRVQRMLKSLRKLGFEVNVTPLVPELQQ
jgi:transposase